MSAATEYEEAKAEAIASVIRQYREAVYRELARVTFGGTPEQQEDTYQKLMGTYERSLELEAPAPD